MSELNSTGQLYKEKDASFGLVGRPEILPFLNEKIDTALDVGCAQGLFGLSLKDKFNCDVWGIEINEGTAQKAEKNLNKVIQGPVEQGIPKLPENTFDAIFFNDVLEHLIDPSEVLRVIKPKLKEDGYIIASIPNVLHFRGLRDLILKKDWKYVEYGVLAYSHLRFFTKKSMIRMFEECGYKIEFIEPINSTKSLRPYFMRLFSFGLLNSEIHHLQYLVKARRIIQN
jgi:2-polyprenyl-3-methyl-5-hydroxy-6-metoxy-1,4-benzoquinol methylase